MNQAIVFAVLAGCMASATVAAQTTPTINLRSGEALYRAGCAGCHGPDGKGMPETTIGFEKPPTFPDFTDCQSTTPELDVDWKATIRDGGRGRGFSRIMPAFGELLTAAQIDALVDYLRGLCRDAAWPRGELNLPRPLVTEKAFPEDEAVVTMSVSRDRPSDVGTAVVYERRLGPANQIELSLPLTFTHDAAGARVKGIGDVGVGFKRALLARLDTGSILSVQGEATFPTGSKDKDIGNGVTVVEAFAAFAQLLPFNSFVQAQAGTEQPTRRKEAPRAVFGRVAVGKSFRDDGGVGRLWSPMLEVIADREFETGAKATVDVIPQVQVTLSRRQHVRVNAGVQVPVANTVERPVQVVFYVLWDWFDGGFIEGWR